MNMNLITNELGLEKEIKSITSPMTPWQVYELGLTINKMIARIYNLLAENCIDRDIIYSMLINNEIEANLLKDRVSLHLNCELLDYYGSRGRFTHNIASEVNRISFDNEFKNFYKQLERFLEIIENRKQGEIPFRAEEVRDFSTKIANDISDLYQAILDLYPQGETKDALNDIYSLTFNQRIN